MVSTCEGGLSNNDNSWEAQCFITFPFPHAAVAAGLPAHLIQDSAKKGRESTCDYGCGMWQKRNRGLNISFVGLLFSQGLARNGLSREWKMEVSGILGYKFINFVVRVLPKSQISQFSWERETAIKHFYKSGEVSASVNSNSVHKSTLRPPSNTPIWGSCT